MSNLKILTDNVEQKALNQIYTLIKQPAFADCKVRIMPDCHAGAGCVIGFTANLGGKVIPNIVGVDIGCGMLTVHLGKVSIDFEQLDKVIRKHIPHGRNIHSKRVASLPKLKNLVCYSALKNTEKFENAIGTLGSGNHFVEIDMDEEENHYLIIHSGSRNLGKQVADHYQNLAIETMQGKDRLLEMQQQLIKEYKAAGRQKEIESAIKELHRTFQPSKLGIPKELCYLEGKNRENYLHDMRICQEYADLNRKTMANLILEQMGFKSLDHLEHFSTIHNYIDHESNIVRKGAISAKKDEIVLIPMNMRDGCIIARGKGNDDWNQSAPHGAGRLMSRSKAKEMLNLEEFEETMKGIYTTCVNNSTLDESPMAYKPMEEILFYIQDTVDVVKIIKPVYNFKAN